MFSTPVRKSAYFRSTRAGFSLIETVIALGIVAVALIPMIGLMPIGLNSYRTATDQMVGACIAQQISGEYNVSSTQKAAQQRYFDQFGQETSGATSDTVYFVNIVETAGFVLPGDSAAGRPLNQVQIEVWYNPSHLSFSLQSNGLISKSAGQRIREYSAYVAQ